jgi:VWFA-related protein
MRSTLLVMLATGLAAIAAAQGLAPDEVRTSSAPYIPPSSPNTLRTDVNLVEVPVVVRDGKRHTIAGLQQSDFEVYDTGKKQAITGFHVETFQAGATAALPVKAAAGTSAPPSGSESKGKASRYVVLCIDDLNTTFADLKHVKDAAERFVRTGLAPDDLVAVVTTAWPRPSAFTADPGQSAESIRKITPQSRFAEEGNSSCPRLTAYQAYLITNRLDPQTLDGVVTEDMACKRLQRSVAVQDVQSMASQLWEHAKMNATNTIYAIRGMVDSLGKLPGRRMLLLTSSGFLSGNLEYLEDELISRAVHAEVVINALDAKGLYTVPAGRPIDAPQPQGRGAARTIAAEASIQGRQMSAKDDAMEVLAAGTGGSFYHNSNDLDHGFQQLGVLPETVYVLGFSPADNVADGRYHSLKVKLLGKHYTLQSRLGYTAPKDAPAIQAKPTALDLAATAEDTPSDVPVTMALQPGPADGNGPSATLVVHLDVGKLAFETRGDRRVQKLIFLTALIDANGAFVSGTRSEMELALKPETYEKLSGPGFNVRLPVRGPAGAWRIRAVVQQGTDGKLTAGNLSAELK